MSGSMSDHQQLRQLAELYAKAVDGHHPELLDAIMALDAVIEGPQFSMTGISEIRGIPEMLKKHYLRTRHEVHNQTVSIDGEQASGETYCTASHLFLDEHGKAQALIWKMRYLDLFSRSEGRWQFSRRKLEIDWTETRPANLG